MSDFVGEPGTVAATWVGAGTSLTVVSGFLGGCWAGLAWLASTGLDSGGLTMTVRPGPRLRFGVVGGVRSSAGSECVSMPWAGFKYGRRFGGRLCAGGVGGGRAFDGGFPMKVGGTI